MDPHATLSALEDRLIGDVDALAATLADAAAVVALCGAGVSVESGIPDFRSPGGLWSRFDPDEYATRTCFERSPEKAWLLYREIGRTIAGRRPNAAHRALAELERVGVVRGIVTQNVDGLHQAAGSRRVIELHGVHDRLRCGRCDRRSSFDLAALEADPVPRCAACGGTLRPDVVLFEEPVRHMDAAVRLLAGCDVLMVVGTSAQVAPASLLPGSVLASGGSIVEFNLEPTDLTAIGLGPRGAFVRGPVGVTLPAVARAVAVERGFR